MIENICDPSSRINGKPCPFPVAKNQDSEYRRRQDKGKRAKTESSK
jgi:hypothetical protein